jgi:chromosome segregation protein
LKNSRLRRLRFYDQATPATEIVEYDPKYRKLISYILNDVYLISGTLPDIFDDPDSIFISTNGKFTKRRHSISGGSVGFLKAKGSAGPETSRNWIRK